MSRSKRRLCGALALLILRGGALAESVPGDTPAPTEAATIEPTAKVEPTETVEPAETVEPTETIEPTESIEPTETI